MAQPNWNTPSGSVGIYPSGILMEKQLSASAVLPAVTITYSIISGNLPNGLTMDENGLIFGVPVPISQTLVNTFVVRATDNLKNIRDRTFTISVTGVAQPELTSVAGTLATINDSIWQEIPINYSNPITSNKVRLQIIQGSLPPGLEMNDTGLIRGYADPPFVTVQLNSVNTAAIATNQNIITCFSTAGFTIGRPIVFTGAVFGGIVEGATYYIHSIIDDSTFTITTSVGGPIFLLSNSVGYMNVSLPNISVGQPTVRTYSFTVKLESELGNDIRSFSITVKNQNAPVSLDGPNLPANSRRPTIYNTRPPSYDISGDPTLYSYYLLPPNSNGYTYSPMSLADIGTVTSDNFFSFKIMGHDFDGNELRYIYADLPAGLTGDPVTGWITGTPMLTNNSISQFRFSVATYKQRDPALSSPYFTFTFKLRNGIYGNIDWITPTDLGVLFNGTVSTSKVEATSDVNLSYRLASGSLPPNLTLLQNGEISGVVSYQPTNDFMAPGETATFTFTIEAFAPGFPIISSQKTFTMSIYQEFAVPTDTLYIKCSPSIADRTLLAELLNNNQIFPTEYLYRPEDPYFGKASSVIYEHAYGIYSSSFDEYIASVTKNHYWRNITLGQIKTAVARNDNGEIIYEVVYSEVIDNLVNPNGVSIPEEITWPRFIPLNNGDWYSSLENIYTSYVGQYSPPQDPTYYTALTPGYARILYPNSLYNMRTRVGQTLGQEYNSNILPKWMTSQQLDGSTTGFVPAWVICYTKPGYSEVIKNNIQNLWVNPVGAQYTLNLINFQIDRFTVDKSTTFNYDKTLSPPAWTGLPSGSPTPDPLDSKDFYVLFPRKTILPNDTQYPR